MIEELTNILQLPPKTLVNKKITKVFFKKNFDLSLTERSLLDDFSLVKGIDWIASFSPASSNIPAYTEETRTFEEVQIIALETSSEHLEKLQGRLAELIQKYIPYHLLLIIHDGNRTIWNVCQKRIHVNEPEKRVIENRVSSEILSLSSSLEKQKRFFEEITYSKLEKVSLKTLYESYTQRIVALKTADLLGIYQPRTSERTKEDLSLLGRMEELEKKIQQLGNLAKKEVQLNRRVELITQIQSIKKEIESIKLKINS
jgi:hypothetical protein